jgi:hypothetical protein
VTPSLSPDFAEITAGLELLKRSLIEMRSDQIDADKSKAMASEISSIRLQLKRIEADRQWSQDAARRERLRSA